MFFAATNGGLRSLVVEREERRLHLDELRAVQDAIVKRSADNVEHRRDSSWRVEDSHDAVLELVCRWCGRLRLLRRRRGCGRRLSCPVGPLSTRVGAPDPRPSPAASARPQPGHVAGGFDSTQARVRRSSRARTACSSRRPGLSTLTTLRLNRYVTLRECRQCMGCEGHGEVRFSQFQVGSHLPVAACRDVLDRRWR